MKELTKKERIIRAINHEEVDRIPYSLWPHYPNIDLNPKQLAYVHVQDAYNYDYDFIKVTGIGLYPVLDYGTKYLKLSNGEPDVDKYGTLQIAEYAINSANDWGELEVLEPKKGYLGDQLKTIYNINDLLNKNDMKDIPVIATIYSPLTVAYKLAGKNLLSHIKTDSLLVHKALNIITDTTIKFIKENINLGIAGFFFSSQLSNYRFVSDDEYTEFGERYDNKLFESFYGKTYFNIIHIHGEDAMFDRLADYQAHCINWHDRWVGPSLQEARKITDKCLLGGIDEEHILGIASEKELAQHVREAIAMGGGRGFILGPGCTVYPKTPASHFQTVKSVVSEHKF